MTSNVTDNSGSITRRTVFKAAGAGIGLYFVTSLAGRPVAVEALVPDDELPLQPSAISKFVTPLLIPPVMPKAGRVSVRGGKNADYYEISVRQFRQQILPKPLPPTTVWGYGPEKSRGPRAVNIHNAPSLTIEADYGRPVRVKWINALTDDSGRYLPHLLPADPTLHWANPGGGQSGRDSKPTFDQTPGPYTGPVPTVTHVHGSVGVGDESDGYPEAWFLPAACNVPTKFARAGTWYDFFHHKAMTKFGVRWAPGSATFQYPNEQRASTLWYHDHALGMTRLNVYAGPVGFFFIRGGPEGDDAVLDSRTRRRAVLPGPAPQDGDRFPPHKSYYEIPLAIQDRSFKDDGSLFYPDSRQYFDETTEPYVPEGDVPPIWNPEFFGNAMMVNGNTWPFLTVEQRRYRFRLLNGCNARFLILDFADIPGVRVWQIGTEGGFLAAPVDISAGGNTLLMAPAERADIIVDFTAVPRGNHVLRNVGPDDPFGGLPVEDVADPESTGQVLQFRVVPAVGRDRSTPPSFLKLPPVPPLRAGLTRKLVLAEEMSTDVPDAPIAAKLGTVGADGRYVPMMWSEHLTENPAVGAVEQWEIYNTTADAHPMHVHDVLFQVVNRQGAVVNVDEGTVSADPASLPRRPEPTENGWKDTVVAYPGEVTRIRMRFGEAGQFVWHCHIVEHEDNEMMRPMRVGPPQPGQPNPHPAPPHPHVAPSG